jgi:hypothetical protein
MYEMDSYVVCMGEIRNLYGILENLQPLEYIGMYVKVLIRVDF